MELKMQHLIENSTRNNQIVMVRVVLIPHQIFTLNNDTILRANNTLNSPSLTLIFASYYHYLLQMNKWMTVK